MSVCVSVCVWFDHRTVVLLCPVDSSTSYTVYASSVNNNHNSYYSNYYCVYNNYKYISYSYFILTFPASTQYYK